MDHPMQAIVDRHERTALFIDGLNFYRAVRSLGFEVDFRRLRKMVAANSRLIHAYYYSTLTEQDDQPSLRPLIDWLKYNGYFVVTKPARQYLDSYGNKKFKGSICVELVINALEIAGRMDHAILFSGDGDLKPLVETLQSQGVRVTVVSSMRQTPSILADDLRRQADNFIELDDLRDQIAKLPEPVKA